MDHSLYALFLVLLFFHCAKTVSQAPAPTPSGPTNITAILERAGQYTTLLRLFNITQIGDQINIQLNNSSQGLAVFAPTDHAFSNLKPGTLNSLSDQQKVALVLFHVVPAFLSMSQFKTVSNPLRTQAGNSRNGEFPLNVTTYSNQVNLSTGVDDATVANTIYTDNQLAVYQVDKVLLPLSLFGSPSPSLAPSSLPSTAKKRPGVPDIPGATGNDVPSNSSSAVEHSVPGLVSFVMVIFTTVYF